MMNNQIIPGVSEYEILLREVRELRVRMAELTAQRDDLLYHVCPALRALYNEKIGSLEREILAAKLSMAEMRRILEILQGQMNRKEKPSYKDAEKKAGEEFRKREEELRRKAEEEEKFRRHWENETRWSAHEREARKAKNARSSVYVPDDPRAEGSPAGRNRTENSERREGDAGRNRAEYGKNRKDDQAGKRADYSESREEGCGGEEKNRDPVERLKRLYRKIVKRLHPDVNPNVTEREKELFNEAAAAYEAGDLEKLEKIWEEIESSGDPGEQFTDSAEGLEKLRALREKLRRRCTDLEHEISGIRGSYPYTMKAFLEDEDAVEEKRQKLMEQLQEIRRTNEELAKFIAAMREQMKE